MTTVRYSSSGTAVLCIPTVAVRRRGHKYSKKEKKTTQTGLVAFVHEYNTLAALRSGEFAQQQSLHEIYAKDR